MHDICPLHEKMKTIFRCTNVVHYALFRFYFFFKFGTSDASVALYCYRGRQRHFSSIPYNPSFPHSLPFFLFSFLPHYDDASAPCPLCYPFSFLYHPQSDIAYRLKVGMFKCTICLMFHPPFFFFCVAVCLSAFFGLVA